MSQCTNEIMCQWANINVFLHWHIGTLSLAHYLSFTLLQVSFRDTVRLKTNLSAVESLSTLK